MLSGARGGPQGLRLIQDEPDRIVLAHEEPFRIGAAEFRPATREVLWNGETSIVEPRVMQLLVALHHAGGSVVSKDDLASLCWEGRIVGEDAINRVVSRLRAVGEKQAGGQFRIETITKVGYRLVPADGEGPRPKQQTRDAATTGHRIGRRELMIGGCALGVAAVAAVGWEWANRDSASPAVRALLDGARGSLCGINIDQAGNIVAQVRKAVQLAPNSAEAWGLLGLAYMRYAHAAPADQRPDLRGRGVAAIRRAFAIEPNQADAMAAQIWATPLYKNWYNFEVAARRALNLHPDSLILGLTLAVCLGDVGRTQEALPYLEKILGTYPQIPENHVSHAFALWDSGRLDEADTAMSRAFEIFPRNISVWFTRLYYLLYNRRASEAAGMMRDIDGRPIGVPDWDYDLTQLQVDAIASSDPSSIRNTIDAWDKAAARGIGFTANGAIFAAFIGDFDECFRLLNALYFNRGIRMADTYFTKEQGIYVGGDRHTYDLFRRPNAAMRRDPRFGQLTRELGLDDYWARTHSRSLVNP